MTQPLFGVNMIVYCRESASLGFLEAYQVNTIQNIGDGWVYTIKNPGPASPRAVTPTFGDRITQAQSFTRYFTEAELCDYHVALRLAHSSLIQQLTALEGIMAAQGIATL